MSTINIIEAMNLFCGDHDPTASNHLTLETFKLPDLDMGTMEHKPGGSPFGVNFAMASVAPFNCTFKLKGTDPERLALFGLGSSQRRNFTGYGVMRDKRANAVKEAKVIIEGVVAKISGGEFSRGAGMDHDYEIREIVSYRYEIDQKEVYDFDFFTNRFSIGGIDQNAESNRILRIPGSGA